MLETNTFRLMTLIGGVISIALAIGLIFFTPMVEVEGKEYVTTYANVMDIDVTELVGVETESELEHLSAEEWKTEITPWQTLWFTVKGKTKGTTNHY